MPLSRRTPGGLPNIQRPYELIRDKFTHGLKEPKSLKEIKEHFDGLVRALYDACYDDARQQNDFNRRQLDAYDSYPAPHAPTHMGGTDNVMGSGVPTPVTVGVDGDEGDGHLGAAPFDHRHAFEPGPLGPLLDLSSDTLNGYDIAYVFAPKSHDLLEQILFELMKLNGEV